MNSSRLRRRDDLPQRRRHHQPRRDDDQRHRAGGLREHESTASHEAAAGAASRRVSSTIGTRHKILDEQHADGDAPVRRVDLVAIGQDLQDDDRARLHDEEAEDHRLRRRQPDAARAAPPATPVVSSDLQRAGTRRRSAPMRASWLNDSSSPTTKSKQHQADIGQALDLGALRNRARRRAGR